MIASSEMEEASEERSWVQCDTCQQWRNLPGCTKKEYERVQAMKRWTCSMNIWDPLRASCAQPEEGVDASSSRDSLIKDISSSYSAFSSAPRGRRRLIPRIPQQRPIQKAWEEKSGQSPRRARSERKLTADGEQGSQLSDEEGNNKEGIECSSI